MNGIRKSSFPPSPLFALAAALIAASGATPAVGAEPARAVIVLDGSGSMWAAMGGRTRIEVAREALGGLLAEWDPAVEVGLVAYGHRRKGDCKDIEVLAPPAKVDRARLEKLVGAVQPKGMTPLSAAVRAAAEALGYTERRATVILVSDGIETCDADPCAVGAELERLGADFTAHVVGFDVGRADQAGLRCLASSTGGSYFDARDAAGLEKALGEARVQIAAPSRPAEASQPAAKAEATLEAVETITLGRVADVKWTGPAGRDDFIAIAEREMPDAGYLHYGYTRDGNPAKVRVPDKPGAYELRYVTGDNRVLARRTVVALPAETSLEAAATVAAGSRIEVRWAGPDNDGDFLTIVPPGEPDAGYRGYVYTRDSRPDRGSLVAPGEPGSYEIRYVSGQGNRVLARRALTVTAVTASLEAPESADRGTKITVRFQGPRYEPDYVTVVAPDAPHNAYLGYTYVRDAQGDRLILQLPEEPGTYELRYVAGAEESVLARRRIVVR